MMKFRFVLLAALLPALAGTGLAEAVPDVAPPVFAWERDAISHWQLSGEGGRINGAPHSLQELVCTVCGSEILACDDGSAVIYDYNEGGGLTRYTGYDASGAVTGEYLYTHAYSEDDATLTEYEFCNGMLSRELLYRVTAQGDLLPQRQTAWYDDGTWARDEYDGHGNLIKTCVYNADGTVSLESESEYALSADGWYYEAKNTIRMKGSVFCTEANEYGDVTRTLNADADGVVWADYRYEYAYEDGVRLWCRQYVQDRLTHETIFGESGMAETETEYLADGTSIVSHFDENGNRTTTVFRNADGTIAQEETCEYIYGEDMNLLAILTHVDGVLTVETKYTMNADGWFYPSVEILYGADGSRTATEYDMFGEVVSVTVYDADGNVTE